jgi:Ca-activated chloride channel family protein
MAAALSAQVFRGGADVVVLNVTVTDAENRFITGLDRGNFQILEDGVLQDITEFAREQQPIALSILLDTSTSMDKRLPIAQEAVVGFAKRLTPSDVAEVIDFDNRVQILQGRQGGARRRFAERRPAGPPRCTTRSMSR